MNPPVYPTEAPKKSNTLRNVLLTLAIIFLVVIGGCVGTCVYLGKKAVDLGQLAEKHPAYATVKLVAQFSPEHEIVEANDETARLVVRFKKTQQTKTYELAGLTEADGQKIIQELMGTTVKLEGNESTMP
jgi:hypothetical protein